MTGGLSLDDRAGEAAAAWRLGKSLCVGCGMYHQMRGALWAAGVFHGAGKDFRAFPELWGRTVRPGHRILIAGCGDFGQLTALRDLIEARPVSVTVMDLCRTPLAMIDELAPLDGIAIETRVQDLLALEDEDAYDLILSHRMLPFVAPEDRPALLARFRAALAPHGRLLITVPVGGPATAEEFAAFEITRISRVRSKLSASPVAMSVIGDAFEAIMESYAADVSRRADAFSEIEAVEALFESAGLRIVQRSDGVRTASSEGAEVARRSHTFLLSRA